MSEMKWYKSGRHCSTQWQELLGPYKYITVITFVKWTFYLEEDIAEGSIYHRTGMRFRADYYGMLYGGYSTSMACYFIFSTANENFSVLMLYYQLISKHTERFYIILILREISLYYKLQNQNYCFFIFVFVCLIFERE